MFSAADIVAENAFTPHQSNWVAPQFDAPGGFKSNGSTDDSLLSATRIQGYSTKASYNLGEAVQFKIDSTASYEVEIYRLGWYGGPSAVPAGVDWGARLIAKIGHVGDSSQVTNTVFDTTRSPRRAVDTSNWVTTVMWEPTFENGQYVYRSPDDGANPPAHKLISGVYYARLVRPDPLQPNIESLKTYSSIPFVIRNDAEATDIVMQVPDTTWQAYNYFGGKSLYWDKDTPYVDTSRSPSVSYNRPYDTVLPILSEEKFTLGFLERNGYSVTYTTHGDVDRYYNEHGDALGPGSLRNHKVYMVGGHDEYWSGEHVKALEMARADDVSMFFLSGNEGFWKTRWSSDYRTLVSYKETQNNSALDPSEVWTGLFRDIRSQAGYNPEFDLIQPENALTGTAFIMNQNGVTDSVVYTTPVTVSPGMAATQIWANSGLANSSQTATLRVPLGPEWDQDLDNGFRPAGLLDLSSVTVNAPGPNQTLQDFSGVIPNTPLAPNTTLPAYGSGGATHSLTMYRGSRTGYVFSAGMSTWSCGLVPGITTKVGSTVPQPAITTEDEAVKQLTVNVLAAMGATHSTPEPEIQIYSVSSDTTPPTSNVFSAANIRLPDGTFTTQWLISGFANDNLGGKVTSVEVSSDGGETWKRATLVGNPDVTVDWTIVLDLPNLPANNVPFLLTRATDDSFNMEKIRVLQHTTSTATNLYVYGGSLSTNVWDNDLVISKASGSFSINNNGSPVGGFTVVASAAPTPDYPNRYQYAYNVGYTGVVTNVTVQLAIGRNQITISDGAIPTGYTRQQVIDAPAATLPGSVTVFGGIGKETVNLDHVKIAGSLRVVGKTGADAVNLVTSVVQGTTNVDLRLNGNSADLQANPIGATVKLDNSYLGGNLTVNAGNGFDKVTATNIIGVGSRTVSTRGGNDTITRGEANQAVENLFALIGGYGNDTYAYSRTSLPPAGENITELDGQGFDTFDLSTAPDDIDIELPTSPDFENVIGSPHNDRLIGNYMHNTFWGNGGVDTIEGGDGNDTVFAIGGAAFEESPSTFNPGAGDNKLFVTSGYVFLDVIPSGANDPIALVKTVVSGGAHLKTNRLWQTSLEIQDTSTVELPLDGDPDNRASKLNDLTIAPNATLDIRDQALVIDYSGASPLPKIKGYILSGRGGVGLGNGTWTGPGLTSSTAAEINASEPEARSVAYAENALLPLGAYTSFRGVTVDSTSILIAYTRTADANLDGVVTNDDVTIIGGEYAPGTPNPFWYLGDFDYNGYVDDDDVTLIGAFYDEMANPV